MSCDCNTIPSDILSAAITGQQGIQGIQGIQGDPTVIEVAGEEELGQGGVTVSRKVGTVAVEGYDLRFELKRTPPTAWVTLTPKSPGLLLETAHNGGVDAPTNIENAKWRSEYKYIRTGDGLTVNLNRLKGVLGINTGTTVRQEVATGLPTPDSAQSWIVPMVGATNTWATVTIEKSGSLYATPNALPTAATWGMYIDLSTIAYESI